MSDMDIRQLTPDYSVSPQISPEDMAAIATAGFRTVINNRPDSEIPPDMNAARMAAAAADAGLTYVDNPFGSMGLGLDVIERQRDAISESNGPVLAFCRTGTRSATIWAFASAGVIPTEDILKATAGAGYGLDGLQPQLDAMAGEPD